MLLLFAETIVIFFGARVAALRLHRLHCEPALSLVMWFQMLSASPPDTKKSNQGGAQRHIDRLFLDPRDPFANGMLIQQANCDPRRAYAHLRLDLLKSHKDCILIFVTQEAVDFVMPGCHSFLMRCCPN